MHGKKIEQRKVKLLVLLNVSLLLEALLYGLIAPLVPYYVDVLHITTGQMGGIVAAYSLALLFGSFPAGLACDRWGNRKVLLFGLGILGLSTFLFSLVNSTWLLVLTRMSQGLASAAIWVAGLAMATVLVPSGSRGRVLGFMMGITSLGTIAGPVIGGIFFSTWGYQAPFYFTAMLLSLVFIGLFCMHLPMSEKEEKKSRSSGFATLKQGIKNPEMGVLFLVIIATSYGFGMLEPLLPLHLQQQFGLDSRSIGFIFGTIGLVYTISQPMVGIISDKVGYWRVIFLGLLASMLFAPIIALASLFWLLLGGICLYAMAASTMMAPCLPKLAELVEKEQNQNYGQSFGLVNAAYSIGLLLGPSVGGMVAQAFSFLAAICIYALILLCLLILLGILGYRKNMHEKGAREKEGKNGI